MKLLTTGQAARRCSVTRDTILKWIRAGRVAAIRTAGGHFRIPEENLQPLSYEGHGALPTDRPPTFHYCWEYFARSGQALTGCEKCIVYQAKATRCFELSGLKNEDGFVGTFCRTRCEDCAYFQDRWAHPVRVLVISDNPSLQRSLRTGMERSAFELRFTSCEYECSTVVAGFRPEYALVDCSLPEDRCEELCLHLAADPRVPDLKIVLAASEPQERLGKLPKVCSQIAKPFDAARLEAYLESEGAFAAPGRESAVGKSG